ncbi:MAG: hypothetical protein QJR13_06545 [Bacillota bacterium]|nr:hypothetical protein [Bacillota bacterium]
MRKITILTALTLAAVLAVGVPVLAASGRATVVVRRVGASPAPLLGLAFYNLEARNGDWSAWEFYGDLPLNDRWSAVGSYLPASYSKDLEANFLHLGVAHRVNSQLSVGGGLVQRTYRGDGWSDQASGFLLGLQGRVNFNPQVAGYASLGLGSLGGDALTEYALGLAFTVNPQVAVTAGYRLVDDGSLLSGAGGFGLGLAARF